MQTFSIPNFLSNDDLNLIGEVEGNKEPFFDRDGVYAGKITSTQQWIDINSDYIKFIQNKLNDIPELKNSAIDGAQILRATNPYDVHSDWIVANNQVQLVDPAINIPTYTIVIPLIEGNYKTIVFNQGAEYNNFNDYKKTHSKINENPWISHCSDYDWKKYCSHCNKEDQKYLTIKEIFHWKRGTLFAFHRKLFHCSANFDKSSKKAIVMWLSHEKELGPIVDTGAS